MRKENETRASSAFRATFVPASYKLAILSYGFHIVCFV